jgi:Flp pilus assembly protein TadD
MGDDPRVGRSARYLLAVLALVVSAWFGLGWYQARQTGKASALVGGGSRLTPRQAQEARSTLDSAGTLNPDRAVDVLRGEQAIDQHLYAGAIRVLSGVTAREPLNLTAWAELGIAAAKTGDRALLAAAGRHIVILIPRVK